MNVSDGILLNMNDLEIKVKEKDTNYLITAKDISEKPKAIKVNIVEYEIC